MDTRYTENFKILVEEAHTKDHSDRWKMAVGDLKRIHKDLPDVVILAAQKLPASEPAILASRLSNTATREIAGIGKEELNNSDFALAVRRTHRSISMQEAADQIVTEKTGIKKAEDFLSLKNAIETRKQASPGLVAIETLKRQGIDARRLMDSMSNPDMKAISVGSFDRVSDEGRGKLNAALEVEVAPEAATEVQRGAVPSMRPPRNQFAPNIRQATFGKRIAINQAMANQQAMGM